MAEAVSAVRERSKKAKAVSYATPSSPEMTVRNATLIHRTACPGVSTSRAAERRGWSAPSDVSVHSHQ
ncbi:MULTISPECIES: hypothetical protein [unclassified Streptomyces]|uniref:Uncharacterized protein n=1 Tax=Streptomyces sp. NBC_00060 TaxID=2975636 RepID=A0AAU2GWS2_9ACTN